VPRRYPTPSRVKIEAAVRAPNRRDAASSMSAAIWRFLYGVPNPYCPHRATGVGCPAWGAGLIPRESNMASKETPKRRDQRILHPSSRPDLGFPTSAPQQERGEEAVGPSPGLFRMLTHA
jgi:hypothetical protein